MLMTRCSVCAISILRIVLALRTTPDNFVHNNAQVGIFTDLEPLLEIIIAYLPVFPATFRRIGRGKGGSESGNVVSSTVARLRSKDPKTPVLHNDDRCPLRILEGSRTQNQITGPTDNSCLSLDDHSIDIGAEISPHCTIKVEQSWEIRSDEAVQ